MVSKKKSLENGKDNKKEKSMMLMLQENERPVDELDEMELKQLKLTIIFTANTLKELQIQRSSLQIERDLIQQFYDNTTNEFKKTEAYICNLETEMETIQETHFNDIRWYVSKVSHLELDNQKHIYQVKREKELSRVGETNRSIVSIADMKKDRKDLKIKRQRQLETNEQEMGQLIGLQEKEIKKLGEEFHRQSYELNRSYQEKVAELNDKLRQQCKMENHEIEERKNLHINDLMENHEKSFSEMRNYYNSITKDNLTLIKSLKEELIELNQRAIQNEKIIDKISNENICLSEPLQVAQTKVQALQYRFQNFEKDKRSLRLTRARSLALDRTLKTMTVQYETLEKRFNYVETERDTLYKMFEYSINRIIQNSNLKNVWLDTKLDAYTGRFERKTTQLNKVISAASLDRNLIINLTTKLGAVLDSKNAQLQNLRFDISQSAKTHDEIMRVYESKMTELGVPCEE